MSFNSTQGDFMKHTKYLSLTQDAVFRRFFTSNKQVLTSLLSEFFFITDKVLDVVVVNTGREETLARLRQTSDPENLPDIHRVVLDLLVKLSSGKKIGIQLQVAINEEKNFVDNIITDWTFLHGHDQNKLTDPSKIHPTYSLIFTHFTVFEEEKDYINEIRFGASKHLGRDYMSKLTLMLSKYPNLSPDWGFRIVIVELNKFNKGCSELINMQNRWNYILKHTTDLTTEQVEHLSQDEDAKMVLQHLGEISKDGSLS